jgi:hypothetical protein
MSVYLKIMPGVAVPAGRRQAREAGSGPRQAAPSQPPASPEQEAQPPITDEFNFELPPTMRVTHQDMDDPDVRARVAEFREAFLAGEVIISDDASCPHCAVQGIQVDEHGMIRDAVTGEMVSSDGTYVAPVPPRADRQRKAARKRQRAGRRGNRRR